MDLVSRPRCVLLGCDCSEEYPGCARCQAAVYSDDFVERGKLHWLYLLRDWWWRLKHGIRRKVARKKCDQCGREFWRGYNEILCSEACHDEWLPF